MKNNKPAAPWRDLADRGQMGAWLARNKGASAWLCLGHIAEELRAPRTTKAQRLELAEALDRLATPVMNLEWPLKSRRGAPDKFQTWRDAALVSALVKYRGAEQLAAVRAVVELRRGGAKARARIERYLRDQHAGRKPMNYSRNEREYEIVSRRISQVRRIK